MHPICTYQCHWGRCIFSRIVYYQLSWSVVIFTMNSSSWDQASLLNPMSLWVSLLYKFHLHLMVRTSFLYTPCNFSCAQFFSQHICAMFFMHIYIVHSTKDTCLVSFSSPSYWKPMSNTVQGAAGIVLTKLVLLSFTISKKWWKGNLPELEINCNCFYWLYSYNDKQTKYASSMTLYIDSWILCQQLISCLMGMICQT